MGHSCGCGHNHGQEDEEKNPPADGDHKCACGHDHNHSSGGHTISPEDAEKLKKAILEAGYKFEETPDGDIKILQQ